MEKKYLEQGDKYIWNREYSRRGGGHWKKAHNCNGSFCGLSRWDGHHSWITALLRVSLSVQYIFRHEDSFPDWHYHISAKSSKTNSCTFFMWDTKMPLYQPRNNWRDMGAQDDGTKQTRWNYIMRTPCFGARKKTSYFIVIY